MHILDRMINLYPNAKEGERCKKIPLWEFLDYGSRPEVRPLIDAVRNEPDKAKRSLLKKHLPAATTAGVFYPQRKNEMLTSFSSLICIDIDGHDNPEVTDWDAEARFLRRDSRLSQHILYAGRSCSGNGLFVLVCVDDFSQASPLHLAGPLPQVSWQNRYTAHFLALAHEFAEETYVVDQQCKNISRCRFASYDPSVTAEDINTDCIPYTRLDWSDLEPNRQQECEKQWKIANNGVYFASDGLNRQGWTVGKVDRKNAVRTENSAYHQSAWQQLPPLEQARRLCAAVSRQGVDITAGYDQWLKVGQGLASLGESGRVLFHQVSALNPTYNRTLADRKFSNLLRTTSRTGIASFFWVCRNNGITAAT